MGIVWLSASLAFLTVGFVIFIVGTDNSENMSLWTGATIIFLSLLMTINALRIAQKDANKSSKNQERIVELLETISHRLEIKDRDDNNEQETGTNNTN